eukprot:ANDGO_02904.mRNA.1 hypothetical protein AMSG_10777
MEGSRGPGSASTLPLLDSASENCDLGTVCAAQVTVWDDVLGPRVAHVWKTRYAIPDAAFVAVGRHSLMEEVSRIDRVHSPEFKMNVMPAWDIVVLSFVFRGHGLHSGDSSSFAYSGDGHDDLKDDATLFAFSVVFRSEALPRLQKLLLVLEDRMLTLSLVLQANLIWGLSLAVRAFFPHLSQFAIDFSAWLTSSIVPCIEQSWFSTNLPEKLANLSPHTNQIQRDFLAKCICAHLQSQCATVVIGDDMQDICRMIGTLALFTDDQRNAISSATPGRMFVPGLYLQGISVPHKSAAEALEKLHGVALEDDSDMASVSSSSNYFVGNADADVYRGKTSFSRMDIFLLHSPFPVAVVDLIRRRVKRIKSLNDYNVLRHGFFTDVLRLMAIEPPLLELPAKEPLLKDLPSKHAVSPPWLLLSTRKPLQVSLTWSKLTKPAPVVSRLVDSIFQIPDHIRPTFIRDSFRLIRRRAMEIVFYMWDRDGAHRFDAFDDSQHSSAVQTPLSVTSSSTPNPFSPLFAPSIREGLRDSALRLLRSDLALESEDDFALFLSLAECLDPGISVAILGDPQRRSEQVLALFEGAGYM